MAEKSVESLVNYFSKGNRKMNIKLLKASTISKVDSNTEFFNLEKDKDSIQQEKLMEMQFETHIKRKEKFQKREAICID